MSSVCQKNRQRQTDSADADDCDGYFSNFPWALCAFSQFITSFNPSSNFTCGSQSRSFFAFWTSGTLLLISNLNPLTKLTLNGFVISFPFQIFAAKSIIFISLSVPILKSSFSPFGLREVVIIPWAMSETWVKQRVCCPLPNISNGYWSDNIFLIRSGITW